MHYAQADALLQGRCRKRRRLRTNEHLERRDWAIAVRILSSDRLVFHPDGRIDVEAMAGQTQEKASDRRVSSEAMAVSRIPQTRDSLPGAGRPRERVVCRRRGDG